MSETIRPMGDVSRRLHGVIRQLEARAMAAHEAAVEAEGCGQVEFAASLRGKTRAYNEAVDLLNKLDGNDQLEKLLKDVLDNTDKLQALGAARGQAPADDAKPA